jgi:hypothetical protein
LFSTCEQPCLNLDGFCSDGAVCSRATDISDGGLCLRHGDAGVGADCPRPELCASGLRCLPSPSLLGSVNRCVPACHLTERPMCGEGQLCRAFSGSAGGVCQPAEMLGRNCQVSAQCGAADLSCLPLVEGNLCTKVCTSSADCGPRGVCEPFFENNVRRDGYCVRACRDLADCDVSAGFECRTPSAYCARNGDRAACEAALGASGACAKR